MPVQNECFVKDGEVHKMCNKCGEDKVLKTSFYLRTQKGKLYFEARCKACRAAQQADRYDPKKKRLSNREYYLNNKDYYQTYWEENKDSKKIHNKIYRIKDSLGGEKLNRGELARRKNERYAR